MPITNTTELALLAADWLNREDLDSVMPTFIAAADSRILADSRSRGEMSEQLIYKNREAENMVNPVPIDTKYYPEWFGFYAEGLDPSVDDEPEEQDLENDTYDLEFLSVFLNEKQLHRVTVNDFFAEKNRTDYETYTEIGGRLYIKGWPDIYTEEPPDQEPYTLELYVHRKTPIDNSLEEPTSDLLRAIPMAYLYATLVEAAVYLKDPEGLQTYQARYEEFMTKLFKDYKRKQVSSGWNVGSVGGDRLFNTRRA